jgi:hypothetical protein
MESEGLAFVLTVTGANQFMAALAKITKVFDGVNAKVQELNTDYSSLRANAALALNEQTEALKKAKIAGDNYHNTLSKLGQLNATNARMARTRDAMIPSKGYPASNLGVHALTGKERAQYANLNTVINANNRLIRTRIAESIPLRAAMQAEAQKAIQAATNLRAENKALKETVGIAGRTKTMLASMGITWQSTMLVAGAAVVAGITTGLSEAYNQTKEFINLQRRLNVVYKEGQGEAAFAWIKDFAATGKADITDLSDALISMSRFGVKPTEGLVTAMADVSAVTKRTVNDIATAIGFASNTGQFWRLSRGLGISKQEIKDIAPQAFKMSITGKEIVVDKQAVARAIQTIMEQSQFKGAAEAVYGTEILGASRRLQQAMIQSWASLGQTIEDTQYNLLEKLTGIVKKIAPILAQAFKYVMGFVNNVISFIENNAGTLKTIGKTLLWLGYVASSLKVGTIVIGGWIKLIAIWEKVKAAYILIIGYMKTMNALEAVSLALKSASVGVLGGWVAIVTGLAAGVAVWAMVSNFIKKVTADMKDTSKATPALGDIKHSIEDLLQPVTDVTLAMRGFTDEFYKLSQGYEDLDLQKMTDLKEYFLSLGNTKAANEMDTNILGNLKKQLEDIDEDLRKSKATLAEEGFSIPKSTLDPQVSALTADLNKAFSESEQLRLSMIEVQSQYVLLRGRIDVTQMKKQNTFNLLKLMGYNAFIKQDMADADKLEEIFVAMSAKYEEYRQYISSGVADKNAAEAGIPFVEGQKGDLNARILEDEKKRYEVAKKIRDLNMEAMKRRNELTKSEILGGGDLLKLLGKKAEVWARFGRKVFSGGLYNPTDANINVYVNGDDKLKDFVKDVVTQSIKGYVKSGQEVWGRTGLGGGTIFETAGDDSGSF